ncbi:hypothetical protein VSS38_12215 [Streptomyces albogriseolus]
MVARSSGFARVTTSRDTEPWEKREAAALRSWLLDAAERGELWFEERDGFTVPRPLTVNQRADELRHDQEVQAVAALYAADHLGKRDASLATVIAAEHVPYLAALRYKDSGLRKRAQWKQVWEQTAPCCSAGPAGTTATRPTPSSD